MNHRLHSAVAVFSEGGLSCETIQTSITESGVDKVSGHDEQCPPGT